MQEEIQLNDNNEIQGTNTQELNHDNINIVPSENISKNEERNPNQSNTYKRKTQKDMLKPASFSSTQKNKNRILEENKEISDFTENKKFRNSIAGSSNKIGYQSGLIDIILKVEKDNVNHYLKGDLAEMYKDINKNNIHFKNNIFLANIDYFEKKTGNLDKKPIIPYNCSEDVSYKLDKYPTTNEIIDKFAKRTKNYQGEL